MSFVFQYLFCYLLRIAVQLKFLNVRLFWGSFITLTTISRVYSSTQTGADPGIFDWGGPNFGSERTVGLFLEKVVVIHRGE